MRPKFLSIGRFFDSLCIYLFCCQILDVITTIWFMSYGFIESNKLFLEIMYFSFPLAILLKIFGGMFIIFYMNKIYHSINKEHRSINYITLFTYVIPIFYCCLLYTDIIYYNFIVPYL